MTSKDKLILVIGSVLAILALAKLQHFTAVLAIFFIAAVGFGVFSSHVGVRVKLAAVAIGLGVILVSNQIELWKEARDRQRQEEVARQRNAAQAERIRRSQEAFMKLSPAEHLAKARALIKLGAPQDSIREGFRHLSAIKPPAPEYKPAVQLRERYEAAKKRYDREQEALRAAAAKKEAAKKAKLLEVARGRYAIEAEKATLDEGYDMHFRTYGPKKTTLEIRYALMGRVFANKFMKSDSSVATIESMGFRKVVFVNSITGEKWIYGFGK